MFVMGDASVDFRVLCSMLEAVVRAKKAAVKRKHLRTFLDHVYADHEYFSAMRLILPELDKERGNYGLKETVLAKLLAEALGLGKDSADAQKLLNWRKGGSKVGMNAGNFAMVAAEVLYRRQSTVSKGIKIAQVNCLLDRLSTTQSREEKATILSEMISNTNSPEMKWIIMMILKDMKLGVSEKTIFSEFHPDAEDLFNVTCDLKLVCDKLKDRSKRVKRQEIEVGKAVRPQLAARVANIDSAWKKLRGKQIVAECKLDGDRIQVHKNGSEVHFFSRNFIDHDQYQVGMSDIMREGITSNKCILDGEMLVWNKVTNRFSDFGSNRGIAKDAMDGVESDEQLCYVAFDILYDGDGSVIHQSLMERKQLLQKVVHPIKGRLELLLPDDGMKLGGNIGGPQWSMIVKSAEEAECFFLRTVENRDEGVVLKDLDSKWEPSDRSGKWLKLKPDYINTGSDLDVLIIGGYFGSGRRGGEVAQFLLGLAEKSSSSDYPTRFLSFCKVGSGLSDNECEILVSKLKPYFRLNDRNTKPPSCYVVTNSAKERPDVWIESPERSVILSISSDIRTINSEVFAAPYSLRFPRIDKIRYDKPWYDCLDTQTLVELVHSKGGSTGDISEYANGETKRKLPPKEAKPRATPRAILPCHFLATDVSQVKPTSKIFKDLVFYFVNSSLDYPTVSFHKMVVENGGSFSMNLTAAVTHVIAANKTGIKYQAAVKHGDVIHYEWVTACATQQSLLKVTPKYYLHLSNQRKEELAAEVDEWGDFYFESLDITDLQQIFENIDAAKLKVSMEDVATCEQKYCPSTNWCTFRGCRIYFQEPDLPLNTDESKVAEVTLKRLRLEVDMREGVVSRTLKDATHLIVYTPEANTSFRRILNRFDVRDKKLLRSKKLHVVSHEWLEKSAEEPACRHPEAEYEFRDDNEFTSDSETEMAFRSWVEGEQTPPGDVLEQRKALHETGRAGRKYVQGCVGRRNRLSSKRRLVMQEGDFDQRGEVPAGSDQRMDEESPPGGCESRKYVNKSCDAEDVEINTPGNQGSGAVSCVDLTAGVADEYAETMEESCRVDSADKTVTVDTHLESAVGLDVERSEKGVQDSVMPQVRAGTSTDPFDALLGDLFPFMK